jgi:hypothetical protein
MTAKAALGSALKSRAAVKVDNQYTIKDALLIGCRRADSIAYRPPSRIRHAALGGGKNLRFTHGYTPAGPRHITIGVNTGRFVDTHLALSLKNRTEAK